MKAAFITETGAPDVIQYGDVDQPEPGEGQVLVKMTACSVNPVDTYIRNGANYWPLPEKFIVGCDLAGTVESVGPGAAKFKRGDRVWCTNQGLMGRQGTFAEFSAIDEHWLYPIPDGVEDVESAACALVGVTAHLGLFRAAKLQANETIFVQGGTGGVGSTVVQMAKAAGARVFATCGTDEKVDACKGLGADAAVNYQTVDVDVEFAKFAPDGANVFWETQRDPDFETIVPRLSERGRLILMAGRDARPPFPVGPFYVKECSMHGVVMFKASPEEMQVCADDMNRWLANGALKANISKTFSLAEAVEAHRLQEQNTLEKAGTISGKIVLVP